MAQNIKINGVTYNSVSSLSIPLNTGGGNAVFPDTSDATAVAGDIASGKTAYVGGSKVTGTAAGGGNYQSKSVTYTSNGSATVTPDSGYDGLSSVAVTVNVASGGGSTGFKVTFPATAANWNQIINGSIIQADGTVVGMADYSTLAGKTIPNVVEIACVGIAYHFLRMTVQSGKVMLTYGFYGNILASTAVNGESSRTYMYDGTSARWIPLADTVISAIEMYNTD